MKAFEFENNGRTTNIEVVLPKNIRNWNKNYDAFLEVTIPANAVLTVTTVSASIEVRDISGDVETKSVSGDIELSGNGEDIILNSVSGKLTLQGSAKSIEAESISGSIVIQAETDELRSSSISGSIRYKGAGTTRLKLKTTSGSIEASCQLLSRARVELNTISGSVELALPAGTDAEFKLKSFSGSIDYKSFVRAIALPAADLEINSNGHKEIRFISGDGTGSVAAESLSGSVTLEVQ